MIVTYYNKIKTQDYQEYNSTNNKIYFKEQMELYPNRPSFANSYVV